MDFPTASSIFEFILKYLIIVPIYATPLIILWLGKFYIPGYMSEKGKNLATKDDIAEITQKIEHVKSEYAKALELHRSAIWLQQQRLVWVREEFSLKFETYKNLAFLLGTFNALIADFHVSYASREIHGLISQQAMTSEKNKDYFRAEYEKARLKLDDTVEKLDNLKFKLKETSSILKIYFNNELPALLTSVVTALNLSCDFLWDREKFNNFLQPHLAAASENKFNDIAHACLAEYLSAASRFGTADETAAFLDELNKHMIDIRTEIKNL